MNSLRNTFLNAYKGRFYPNYRDMLALLFVLGILVVLAWNAKQMATPYQLGMPTPISLDPSYLPGYALRTILRMLIALFFSLLFTLAIGTWAAKSKKAEKIIIPLIDIFQSIPILGFQFISVVMFIRLFPHSMLGPECAAVFAIFTSQAWNMTLGFYQTVRSVPSDLKEAANMFHLSAWQRFWRIDVPFSLPSLLWNMMMSMSAGWFFVVAAEALTVSQQEILLPGIGSYITTAIQTSNLAAIGYAIFTMLVVILIYDQLLFRPLVAWAEKFKSENTSNDVEPQSWLINFLQRTRLLRHLGVQTKRFFDAFVNMPVLLSKLTPQTITETQLKNKKIMDIIFKVLFIALVLSVIGFLVFYILRHFSLASVFHVFILGCYTALRVFILLILVSLIWVPIGVWIGLRPQVSAIAQPIAQFLAAFPANLFYPLVVVMIVTYHLNVEIWLTPLMILGAQWYVLFNVIAGASMIPKELLLAVDNLGANTWLKWRKLILPAIFPYYITGAITAAGGAWNASIVAEVVNWGHTKLVATGLGSYINEYTEKSDFAHLALGISMMCIFVLIFNRLVWRPLYFLAESRYQLTG